MNSSWPNARIARQAETAIAQSASARAVLPSDGAASPAVGDLFVIEATAAYGVEWAVVECESEASGDFCVVPADTGSLVGGADVEVTGGSMAGPLVLRCAHALSVPAAVLRPEMRTGQLAPDSLTRVRDRCQQLATGQVQPGGDALEAQADPEYEALERQLLRPATRALAKAAALVEEPRAREAEEEGAPAIPPADRVSTFPARAWRQPLAWAATLLLVASLGFARGFFARGGRVAELQNVVDQQHQEGRRAREQYDAELDAQRHRHTQVVAEQEARLGDLEERLAEAISGTEPQPPVPMVGLPQTWLVPHDRRGDAQAVQLPAGAQHVLVMLQFEAPASFPEYHLEILDAYDDRIVWRGPVALAGMTELPLVVPRGWLEAGEYQLRLLGKRGAASSLVARYTIDWIVE